LSQYYVLDSQHGTLRIAIDKCMDIFNKDVHLYNNTGKIFISTTVQPFHIDNILKEYYINISWKAGKRGQIEDTIQLCHDILFIIVQFRRFIWQTISN
jgi:hypothetical protein